MGPLAWFAVLCPPQFFLKLVNGRAGSSGLLVFFLESHEADKRWARALLTLAWQSTQRVLAVPGDGSAVPQVPPPAQHPSKADFCKEGFLQALFSGNECSGLSAAVCQQHPKGPLICRALGCPRLLNHAWLLTGRRCRWGFLRGCLAVVWGLVWAPNLWWDWDPDSTRF